MGYALELGAWSTVFAVPGALVDNYIKDADGDALKVVLFLLRNGGRTYSAGELADAVGISPVGAQEAISYWIGKGLLAEREESLSTKLLPAEPSAAAPAAPPKAAAAETPSEGPKRFPVQRLPRPDGVYVSQYIESDSEIRSLLEEVEGRLGKPLSVAFSGTLIQAHEDYGLPCGVLLMLVQYALKHGKANANYISKTAWNWADAGIVSIEAAERRLHELDETMMAWRRCERIFGLTPSRDPSETEGTYAYRWTYEWNTPDELLREAYERCVDNKGKLTLGYVNGILERWRRDDIRTLEDAKREQAEHKAGGTKKRAPTYDLEAYKTYDFFDDED